MKKYCIKCGNQLDTNMRFCSCGTYNLFYLPGLSKTETESQAQHSHNAPKSEYPGLIKQAGLPGTAKTPGIAKPKPFQARSSGRKRSAILLLSLIFIAGSAFAWCYFINLNTKQPISSAPHFIPPGKTEPVTGSKIVTKPLAVPAADSSQKLAVAVVQPDTVKTKTEPVAQPVSKKPLFRPINESKVRGDLVGRKLSGCDIVVRDASQIASLDNLVLVEKLPDQDRKYKFIVKIKQGGDTYTASPYIYYSLDGTVLRIDGTNCE